MNRACFGVLAVAGMLAVVAMSGLASDSAQAQRPAPMAETPSDGLIALPVPAAGGRQFVAIVDPSARSMGVYEIDGSSGKISLMSVRKVNWDLQMSEFNGVRPLPEEIRNLLEQK